MKIVFSVQGWADYQHWVVSDANTLKRLNELIRDASRPPFKGMGKPEPLGGNLKGWWSRRITTQHRLVYRMTGSQENQALEIAACRFHYER